MLITTSISKECVGKAGESTLLVVYERNVNLVLDALKYTCFQANIAYSYDYIEARYLLQTSASVKFHKIRV